MTAITLDAIAEAMTDAGMRAAVERLGGNVYGVVDFGGWTVTINDGQREAEDGGPIDFLICHDGTEVSSGVIEASAEVPALAAAAGW